MRKAYTLVEVLTVLLILMVLMGIILPTLRGVKASTNKTVCSSNMHQIYLALKLYESDGGGYPPTIINFKPFESYYPTALHCPSSKHLDEPNLRVIDYTYLGFPGSVAGNGLKQQDTYEEFDRCKQIRASSMPLILDQNHVAFNISQSDKDSQFLLVREDGSYSEVLAWASVNADKPCNSAIIPGWYNY